MLRGGFGKAFALMNLPSVLHFGEFGVIGTTSFSTRMMLGPLFRVWIKGCLGTIHSTSGLRAELFGIWMGLILAWDCGCRDVVCEMDSLEAFLVALSQANLCHAADADLISKIHEVPHLNWNAQVILIQRNANTAVDFLAKHAVERNIEHMELLQPLDNMQTRLSCNSSSFSVRS
ncbi:hypothetical protein PIB30_041623 [Stylosanthes scabra]|uniref:RNase H type-1 domain-containing protein n=1 Tax=Stylosanthes scabra TaxID=79078 RepID=A0ABU6XGQ1_9FABA|nr:hypothetical protein [Stylosanthes scabra]